MSAISDSGQSMYSDGKSKTYTSKDVTLRKVTADMLSPSIEEKYNSDLMLCNLGTENITKMFYDKDGWVYFPLDSHNSEKRYCRFYLKIKEWKFKENMSSSEEQQKAEKYAVEKVEEWLKYKLEKNKKVNIADDVHIEPDFYSEEHSTIGEIYAHIGKVKGSQSDKISQDILKMILMEKCLGKTYRKIIVVIDEQLAKYLTGNSFIAESIRQFNIEVKKIEVPEDMLKSVKEAQKRQKMKNV